MMHGAETSMALGDGRRGLTREFIITANQRMDKCLFNRFARLMTDASRSTRNEAGFDNIQDFAGGLA